MFPKTSRLLDSILDQLFQNSPLWARHYLSTSLVSGSLTLRDLFIPTRISSYYMWEGEKEGERRGASRVRVHMPYYSIGTIMGFSTEAHSYEHRRLTLNYLSILLEPHGIYPVGHIIFK
ncbi:hypothetical protein AFLA_012808 [Aspergillus flavus NRRL3357]|nr:hypothetical protein AFLA_012808 [Aspergillus flavus NRRL3357]